MNALNLRLLTPLRATPLRTHDTRAVRGRLWFPRSENMTQPSTERLFAVYGTLRKGDDNDITRLVPPPRLVGTASVGGQMFHLGAYPGVLLLPQTAEQTERVHCEVYAVSTELEAKLDAIEAEYPAQPDEYAKRSLQVTVRTAHGQRAMEVQIYEINPRYVVGKPRIASGDWVLGR